MAFGLEKNTKSNDAPKNADGTTKKSLFPTIVIPTGINERRMIRFMPSLEDPSVPEDAVYAYSLWINTDVGKRRIFFGKDVRYDLPAAFEPLEGKIINRAWMNVYDMTPVIVAEVDESDPDKMVIAYPDAQGKFYTGWGDKKKIHEGKGTPNKRVMVLEAPLQLMNDLSNLPKTTITDENESVGFMDMQVAFMAVPDANDARRTAWSTGGTALSSKGREWHDLPRYDLRAYAPYPAEAVHRLADGEPFNDIVKEYDIVRFANLIKPEEEIPF